MRPGGHRLASIRRYHTLGAETEVQRHRDPGERKVTKKNFLELRERGDDFRGQGTTCYTPVGELKTIFWGDDEGSGIRRDYGTRKCDYPVPPWEVVVVAEKYHRAE